LVWEDSQENLTKFENALKKYDCKLLKGGRFYHLMGNTDKGNGVRHLMKLYREKYSENEFVTIGIGDSPNDIDMLSAVNIPILVKRPDNSYIDIPIKNKLVYADGVGPIGWNMAIQEVLTEKLDVEAPK
jgi:mannosyl-3-phosphoglycerate phosphatase